MARIITTRFNRLGKKSPYNKTISFLVLALVISAIFLTGCSSDRGEDIVPTATPVEIEKTEPVQTQDVAIDTPDKAGNASSTKVSLKDYYWLLESLGGKELLDETYITAEFDRQMGGFAGCNTYNAYYEQAYDTLVIRQIIPQEFECSEPPGLMEQEIEYFYLLDRSKKFVVEDGQLKLYERDGQPTLVFNAVVLGGVFAGESMTLPENAVTVITLTEIGDADSGTKILAEETITDQENFPVPFVIPYDPAKLDPTKEYVLTVEIEDGDGNLVYRSPTAFPVLTQGNPSVADLILEAIQ